MNLLEWFLYQWNPSTFSQGTWYNIPATLLGAFSILIGIIFMGIAIAEGNGHEGRNLARWSLAFLFLVPLVAVLWPVTLPVAMVVGIGILIRRAW